MNEAITFKIPDLNLNYVKKFNSGVSTPPATPSYVDKRYNSAIKPLELYINPAIPGALNKRDRYGFTTAAHYKLVKQDYFNPVLSEDESSAASFEKTMYMLNKADHELMK